jgi:predicted Zn-dependent protease
MTQEILEAIRQNPRLVVAQDYEITCQRVRCEKRQYLQGQSGVESFEESWWVLLRLIHRNRPGIAITTTVSKESLNRLVSQAIESAEQSHPDPWFRFPIWPSKRKEKAAPKDIPKTFWEPGFPKLGLPELQLNEWYELWDTNTLIFRRSERSSLEHREVVGKQTWTLGRDSESFFGFEQRETRLREFIKAVETKKYAEPLVGDLPNHISLSPRALAPVLDQITSWFLSDQVRAFKSPLQFEDLGKPVMSQCLELYDDGLNENTLFSGPFDLEGINSQKTPLVAKGVLRNFLYDSYSGVMDNRLSTGNRIRFPGETEARLGARALCLESGSETEKEIWDVKSFGLAIEGWNQMEISTDLKLRGSAYGWKKQKGLPDKPVKFEGLEWDLKKLLFRAEKVASDSRCFGNISCPTVFFAGLAQTI